MNNVGLGNYWLEGYVDEKIKEFSEFAQNKKRIRVNYIDIKQ